MYFRTLRGFTMSQSYRSSPGSGPDVHLLDLFPVTQSHATEGTHKTSVWSLASMLPFLSILQRMASGTSLNVIGRAITGVLSPRAQI